MYTVEAPRHLPPVTGRAGRTWGRVCPAAGSRHPSSGGASSLPGRQRAQHRARVLEEHRDVLRGTAFASSVDADRPALHLDVPPLVLFEERQGVRREGRADGVVVATAQEIARREDGVGIEIDVLVTEGLADL